MKKSIREAVYRKYNGHCAYCGKDIEYKDMQVDHQLPKMFEEMHEMWKEQVNSFENLFPSCRRCNHYKRSMDLENFRDYMQTLHERIEKDYIAKVAIDYGIVTINPFDGKFYFEVQHGED